MLELALLFQRAKSLPSAGEALASDVHEITVEGEAGRNLEFRKWCRDFLQAQAAAVGNVQRA